MDYKRVTECRICKSRNLHQYLDLGAVPLCNNLLDIPDEPTKYPIEVLLCKDCFLSQLSVVVDPNILYSNYLYHSSVSNTFKQHCFDMAIKLKEFKFDSDGFKDGWRKVLDIASNDGCLLKEFRRAGNYTVYGVEPAGNLIPKQPISAEDTIPVFNTFWSETCLDHTDASSTFNLITALNVFAHVDDNHDFLKGVIKNLTPDGVFVMEVPYMAELIKKGAFDTIYHEHLSYFLLAPLVELFKSCGLPIFRVEEYSIHGGTIRIYASKDRYPEEQSVQHYLDYEGHMGLYDIDTYDQFSKKVNKIREDLIRILVDLHADRRVVMAYGASAKGISLLNYTGIPKKYISYIVDDTVDKQGKFTPGSNIPIVDKRYFDYQPDYLLLLPWNFADELMAKTKHMGAKYIVPIPEVRVI